MSDLTRLQFVFSGRVQNVGFRATTRDAARAHPLTGWVRNDPTATSASRSRKAPPEVNAMIDALRSRMAGYIREARTEPMIPSPGETDFGIRR